MATEQERKRNRKETKGILREMQTTNPEYFQAEEPAPESIPRFTDVAQHILRTNNLSLSGGPFHYSLRAGTYGDPWDEVPWKVRMGITLPKERGFGSDNSKVCTYEPRVLLQNWWEDKNDRKYIKYKAPRLSQYGHHYVSESMRSYTKHVCNKERDVLLTMAQYPTSVYPGHQPELDLDILKCSTEEPEECVINATVGECQKEMARQKRYYKATIH